MRSLRRTCGIYGGEDEGSKRVTHVRPVDYHLLQEPAPLASYTRSVHFNANTSAMIVVRNVCSGTVGAVVVEVQNEFLGDTSCQQGT